MSRWDTQAGKILAFPPGNEALLSLLWWMQAVEITEIGAAGEDVGGCVERMVEVEKQRRARDGEGEGVGVENGDVGAGVRRGLPCSEIALRCFCEVSLVLRR